MRRELYEVQRAMRARREAALKRGVIAVLDIGTAKVACLVLQFVPDDGQTAPDGQPTLRQGAFRVIGAANTRSRGVTFGEISSMEECERAVRTAIQGAQKMAGLRVDHVIVSFAGGRPRSYGVTGNFAYTNYAAVAGRSNEGVCRYQGAADCGIFTGNSRVRIRDVRDGTSNTFATGEVVPDLNVAYRCVWAGVADRYNRSLRMAGIRHQLNQTRYQPELCLGSRHEGGGFFLFCDGQVRFISENIDAYTYRYLATRAMNEIIDDEDY